MDDEQLVRGGSGNLNTIQGDLQVESTTSCEPAYILPTYSILNQATVKVEQRSSLIIGRGLSSPLDTARLGGTAPDLIRPFTGTEFKNIRLLFGTRHCTVLYTILPT